MSEQTRGLDQGRGGHRLSILRRLRRARNISTAASARPAARRIRWRNAPAATGTVYATSLVCRAATPETRAHVPYNIVLVDTPEGFRMMAHGDNDLAIGDEVTARYQPFAGRLVPYFAKVK